MSNIEIRQKNIGQYDDGKTKKHNEERIKSTKIIRPKNKKNTKPDSLLTKKINKSKEVQRKSSIRKKTTVLNRKIGTMSDSVENAKNTNKETETQGKKYISTAN